MAGFVSAGVIPRRICRETPNLPRYFWALTKPKWWAAFLSVFALVPLSAPLAVLFGYMWLATDEPDRTYTCKGSSTCYSGETVNMMLASAFGAMVVICAGITIVVVIRWRRWRDAQPPQPREIFAEM